MKKLTLIRHAKSSWKDPFLSDFDRPLNKRGKEDAPIMGKRLAMDKVVPDLILSSPAKRAKKTAKIVAQEIGFSESKIKTKKRSYLADDDELVDVLKDHDDILQHIMLVGHNPGLTDLANLIAKANIDNIPTSGVVMIDLNVDSWSKITKGCGKVTKFDYPKKIDYDSRSD